jgi:hypothetical protein
MTREDFRTRIVRPKRNNTSGYLGVSWSKAAAKWEAYITVQKKRHHLGLFSTGEEAHAAQTRAAEKLLPINTPHDPSDIRAGLLETVRSLYDANGIQALSTPFLEKQSASLYHRLLAAGLKQPELLKELGLTEEYEIWRPTVRTYGGVSMTIWTWESVVEKAKELKEREGDLPTVEWFRLNGYGPLTAAVHASDRTWEELREAVGCFATSNFIESRNGMRWRSRPEASLSNFLYARGIEHRRGELYASDYSRLSGRRSGRLDMHFVSATGALIDVEVWGDPLNRLSGGRYQATRAHKEKYQAKNPNFLGIPYQDCLSDRLLEKVLEPYIGLIEPFQFDKPADRLIETSHWSNADELLKACQELAKMCGGIFPGEGWLRKRGKYADRPGPAYNTLSIRVNQWLGGTRKVREILGQSHIGNRAWTAEKAVAAWQNFHQEHGLTPSQCKKATVSPEIRAEAARIYSAALSFGVVDIARQGRNARKIIWTSKHTLEQWREFQKTHGRTPSQCMSAAQRRTLPRAVTDEATRIYGAARRLGILPIVRQIKQK